MAAVGLPLLGHVTMLTMRPTVLSGSACGLPLFSRISRSVGAPAASYAYARARLRSGRSAISSTFGARSRRRIPRSSIRDRIRWPRSLALPHGRSLMRRRVRS